MVDVFISYSRQDERRAEWVVGLLEGRGFSVWWDRQIPPGRTWDQVIGAALDEAACVVVLWSRESVQSDWVKEEAARGARRQALVPVVFDHVEPPLGFGRIEAAQLSDADGVETHPEVQSFVAAVRAIVGADDRTETPGSAAAMESGVGAASTALRPRPGHTALAATLGAALLLVATGLWWFSDGVVHQLQVAIWDVDRDRPRSMVASHCVTQTGGDAPGTGLVREVAEWAAEVVTAGRADRPPVTVRLEIPADLDTGRIRRETDPGVTLQTHLYVVTDTGKERVRIDLDQAAMDLPQGELSIEIGAPGYSSVPFRVEPGRAVSKTVTLKPVAVKLAVENFTGSENRFGPRLTQALARRAGLSVLAPDALERLRAEISEAREDANWSPFVQSAIRDSLGVDFIVGGSYQLDPKAPSCPDN